MIRHCILLSSSYSTGRRIGLHYAGDDDQVFQSAVRKVASAYDGKIVSFSTHTIHTDSDSWESVVKKDPYFDDVALIGSPDEFVELIQKDRYLTGLEVSSYILTRVPCTHTRLEKLTYMCYADYLCDTGTPLFRDRIFAFEYGPVVESVYKRYRSQDTASKGYPIKEPILDKKDLKMPFESRILFSEDGLKKKGSIDSTLSRLSGYKTEQMVEMIHRDETPWAVSYDGSLYKEITDGSILSHHRNEI